MPWVLSVCTRPPLPFATMRSEETYNRPDHDFWAWGSCGKATFSPHPASSRIRPPCRPFLSKELAGREHPPNAVYHGMVGSFSFSSLALHAYPSVFGGQLLELI